MCWNWITKQRDLYVQMEKYYKVCICKRNKVIKIEKALRSCFVKEEEVGQHGMNPFFPIACVQGIKR